jgi:nitrite reductase/ring-hydroxylating ferredoxin subunit
MGGPLCDGSVWGEVVQCPWHGSEFNVRTGEVVSGPAEVEVQRYAVDVVEGVIEVRSERRNMMGARE